MKKLLCIIISVVLLHLNVFARTYTYIGMGRYADSAGNSYKIGELMKMLSQKKTNEYSLNGRYVYKNGEVFDVSKYISFEYYPRKVYKNLLVYEEVIEDADKDWNLYVLNLDTGENKFIDTSAQIMGGLYYDNKRSKSDRFFYNHSVAQDRSVYDFAVLDLDTLKVDYINIDGWYDAVWVGDTVYAAVCRNDSTNAIIMQKLGGKPEIITDIANPDRKNVDWTYIYVDGNYIYCKAEKSTYKVEISTGKVTDGLTEKELNSIIMRIAIEEKIHSGDDAPLYLEYAAVLKNNFTVTGCKDGVISLKAKPGSDNRDIPSVLECSEYENSEFGIKLNVNKIGSDRLEVVIPLVAGEYCEITADDIVSKLR